MNRLVGIELTRFTSRRSVRVFCVVALLAMVAAGSLTFAFSDRDVAGATVQARRAATQEHEACLRGEIDPHERPPGFVPSRDCIAPDLSEVTGDPRFHLTSLRDILGGTAAMLVLIGLAIGASSIGAEWHHRTMTTALTWEARRARLVVGKMAAAAIATSAGVLVLLTLLSLALAPAAVFRGTASGVSGSWFLSVAGLALRGSLLAGMGAVVGAALATISRNTALAIGISFGWLTAVENIIRGVRPQWQSWTFGDNAASLVAPGGEESLRTSLGGGVILTVYVAALAAIAIVSFRRRDVA
jgi:ABC-type transport system involved in multi-copper enzyme maturation permease subunit